MMVKFVGDKCDGAGPRAAAVGDFDWERDDRGACRGQGGEVCQFLELEVGAFDAGEVRWPERGRITPVAPL